ncbi:TetR/AcrR family transcriptional regulator [Williamsia sp. M5A3_1d]
MSITTGRAGAADRIRRAAIDAFAESGYAGTSTREITRRLNMSATAMYPHFDSKEELLFDIALEGHRSVLAAMRAADDPAATPAVRLEAVVAAFARWQAEFSSLARVVQYELGALTPAHYREIVAIRRETMGVIAAIAEAGRAAGDFDIDDVDGMVLAISSLCVDVCRWFPSGAYRDPVDLGVAYARIALRMVR